jgi:hypothetical protein
LADPAILAPTGAIQAFLNATSLQHILDDFAVLVPDFLAMHENFTFDLETSNKRLYSVRLSQARIDTL